MIDEDNLHNRKNEESKLFLFGGEKTKVEMKNVVDREERRGGGGGGGKHLRVYTESNENRKKNN